jgi:hypothetical protein
MESPDERGGVICSDPIDRNVERFDALAAEVSVQLIDERRTTLRERA